MTGFNPRSRVGSDLYDGEHTVTDYSFNPRSRVGSDKADPKRLLQVLRWFQSTLPRGERHEVI